MENKCENPNLQVLLSQIDEISNAINKFNNAQLILEKELQGGINNIDMLLLTTEDRDQFIKEYKNIVDAQMASSRSQVNSICESIKKIRRNLIELLKKFLAYKDNKGDELSDIERFCFMSVGDCSKKDLELCKQYVDKYK